jgi:hypothetical protein
MSNIYRILLTVCWLGIVLIACNNHNHNQDVFFDNLDAPIISAKLKYEIPVLEDEKFFFGGISDMSVLSDGSIAILDDILKKIHLFTSDGNFINSVLSKGRGPGEIVRPYSAIRTSKNDKVAFYDQALQRISLFNYSDNDLLHLQDIKIDRMINDFHIMPDGKIVVYEPSPIGEVERKDQVFLVKPNGEFKSSPITVFDGNDQLMLSPSVESISLSMGISTNYHTKNLICFLGSRMIHNRSNYVGFTIYDLETGAVLNEIKYNRPDIHLPVSKREEVIDGILDTGLFGKEKKSQLLSEMPNIYPQVRNIKCEPDEHVWLDITTEDEKSEWVLFSETGVILGRLDPDFDETILHFSQNVIYTKTADNKGNFSVKAYTYSLLPK